MRYRRFGRTDWMVSEIGYGMWEMARWNGSDNRQSEESLNIAVEKGVNFFDTAWDYGEGRSERLLGGLVKRNRDKRLYVATKIPPKNMNWLSKSFCQIQDCFPTSHIVEYAEKSLQNLGLEQISLLQFHIWEDRWAQNEEWQKAVEKLKKEGKVAHFGISVNRWEPENCLKTIATGYIDAVQADYNIFDQSPEDKLMPTCKELDIAFIARVPFDEGTLTGNIKKHTKFPVGDRRATYFEAENLKESAERASMLRAVVPEKMTMAEMALKFVLANKTIATTIPGMSKKKNVLANTSTSNSRRLKWHLMNELKCYRWDRKPAG